VTKSELYEAFRGQISRKAITGAWPPDENPVEHLEYAIVGKFCRVVDMDSGGWDVWLCNPRDLAAGLGTGKLHNIIRGIEHRCFGIDPGSINFAARTPGGRRAIINGRWNVLDGEAYTQTLGVDDILRSVDLLGISRKREVSDAHRKRFAEMVRARRAGGDV